MFFVFSFSLSVEPLQIFSHERFVYLRSQFDCLGGAVQVEEAGEDALQGSLLLVRGALAGHLCKVFLNEGLPKVSHCRVREGPSCPLYVYLLLSY